MSSNETKKKGYTTSEEEVLSIERDHIKTSPHFGLALSGGGIRSASFALGILQALAIDGQLKKVDYMSTVSGGGYIGSALTWWLSKKIPFPPSANTSNEILDFLRFHSSYLNPTRELDTFSFLAVLLRNFILCLLIYLGALTGVVFFFTAAILSFDLWWNGPIAPRLLIGVHDSVQFVFKHINPTENAVSGSVMKRLFELSIYSAWIFLVGCILYSFGTLYYQIRQLISSRKNQQTWSSTRYKKRNSSQILFGFFFKWGIYFFLLGSIPLIESYQSRNHWIIATMVLLSVVLVFFPFDTNLFQLRKALDQIRRTVGAMLFVYALLFVAYLFSIFLLSPVTEILADTDKSASPFTEFVQSALVIWTVVITFVLSTIIIAIGSFTNVNYLGIHRMYRDRLMELFLSDEEAVTSQSWRLASQANYTVIEDMCREPNVRPYHVINTNVVLVDSQNRKYRERGGANFIISPLFCGSDATGWVRSDMYMKRSDPGMTLATAMAISGAAANPNAGAGGSAWTRNRMVSIMMSVLNLRLGYWAPHPNPQNKWLEIPNLIYPGITSVFLWQGLHEDARILDLTDGGHFENLGLYELIRRRLSLIVVSDGSADPHFHFKALGVSIERARVDFGISVTFLDGFGLENLVPGSNNKEDGDEGKFSKRGFAVAQIEYKEGGGGILVYIKPTLVYGVGPEVTSYKDEYSNFPHETTADQFFDEIQFEAYRELGYFLGKGAAQQIESAGWFNSK